MLLAVVTLRTQFRIVAETALPNGLQYAVLTPAEFVRAVAEGDVFAAMIDAAAHTADLRTALEGSALRGRFVPVTVIDTLAVGSEQVWPSSRQAICRQLRREALRRVGRVARAGTALHRALCALRDTERPFRSITDLAAHVNCERETLAKEWKRACGRAGGPSLALVVTAILFLEILGADHRDGEWKHKRAVWGIGRGRGNSFAQRTLGKSFEETATGAAGEFFAWFNRSVLDPLGGIRGSGS